MIKELSRTKGVQFNLGALLRDVQDAKQNGDTLSLSFRNSSMEERVAGELSDPRGRNPVETAVENAYAVKLKVVIARQDANGELQKPTTAMDSHIVRAAVTMGARILDEGSVSSGGPAKSAPTDTPETNTPDTNAPEANATNPNQAG
ncbi:MAG TPA: hypothetical protein DGB32_03245 [Dehalococcoidia bacterium]|nr:hypothetical protein [Dehalococcoidia bacterium]